MRRQYIVASGDGYGEYSADARDYWYAADSDSLAGALVRMDHPYRTTTGRTVYAPRMIREHATVRDLRRLQRAGAFA